MTDVENYVGPDADGEMQLPDNRFAQPEVITVRHGAFGVMDDGDTTGFGGLVETFTLPGASPRPYGSWFDEAVDVLEELIRDADLRVEDVIEKVVVNPSGELIIYVAREHLPFVARQLRDDQDLRFEMCMGVSAVNYPGDVGRELQGLYPLRWRHPTTTPAFPRSFTSTPAMTGRNVKPGISWESFLMGIPASPGLRCLRTGWATRNARTTRWVASQSNTVVRRCPRLTRGGLTTDVESEAEDFCHAGRRRPQSR